MRTGSSPTLLVCWLAAAACVGGADPAGPPGGPGPGPVDSTVPDGGLHFLRADPSAPPLAERTVSFWAVKGSRREVRLMYRPVPGAPDSVEFARFRVEDRSLERDPAGTLLADGDSLLITLTIVDTLNFVTDFQPSGLVFNAAKPARLWLKFGEADPDLNNDGIVSAADTTLLFDLRIWKQEQPGQPWTLLPSTVDTVSQEIEADIMGFTRYAVAY